MKKLVPGSLLIAPPSMMDGRFGKTVLLLTHHNKDGSYAICLNRPTNRTLVDIGRELKLDTSLPFTMHWGGPVQQGSIWMVHTPDWSIEETMTVTDEYMITSNEKMFHHLADGDVPREFRVAFGFSSWAPGQLDMEMNGIPPFKKQSSWLVLNNPDPEWLWSLPIDDLWEAAVFKAGEEAVNAWLP